MSAFRSSSARRPRHARRSGYLRIAGAAVGLIAALWAVGFLIFVDALPEELETAEVMIAQAEPADGIVVLTGGAQRLKTGLALLERGAGQKLFVSGVHQGVDVAELLRVSQQDPARVACCIELGYLAGNTRGNAAESAEWARASGFDSIRLVTADYHMPRSLLEFRILAPDLAVTPHPVFPGNVRSREWYKFPGTALFIAGEYTKTLLSLARLGVVRLVRSL